MWAWNVGLFPGRRLASGSSNIGSAISVPLPSGCVNCECSGASHEARIRPDSDIDLLVDVGPEATAFDLLALGCDLEDELNVRVDVGTESSLLLRSFEPRCSPKPWRCESERMPRVADRCAGSERGHLRVPGWREASSSMRVSSTTPAAGRLIEIGEADQAPCARADRPGSRTFPWRAIARMRDQLAHRYFDTDHAIVAEAVTERLPGVAGGGRTPRWLNGWERDRKALTGRWRSTLEGEDELAA